MRAIFIKKNINSYNKVVLLKKNAEKDGASNIARRMEAIILNMDGNSSTEIAEILGVSRCQVSEWIRRYLDHGPKMLFEGVRPGRPGKLTIEQINDFYQRLQNGPNSDYLKKEKWTLALIEKLLLNRYNVKYHPVHLRKILHLLDFSLKTRKTGKKSLPKNWIEEINKLRWLRSNPVIIAEAQENPVILE